MSRIIGISGSLRARSLNTALLRAAACINMWIGVAQAGYSVAEELPILSPIFAPPAVAAAFVWWKFS